MISVLIPTRGRPEGLRRTLASLSDAVGYVGLDKTDDVSYAGIDMPEVLVFGDDPTSWKWNKLAGLALQHKSEIFVLGSDDVVWADKEWTKKLRETFAEYPDGIACVGFNDGRTKDGTPHFALHRNWLLTLGYFVPPFLHHWAVDTWTVEVAKKLGRFVYAQDIVAKHNTVKDTGVEDETHKRIRRTVHRTNDNTVMELFDRYRESDAAVLRRAMK